VKPAPSTASAPATEPVSMEPPKSQPTKAEPTSVEPTTAPLTSLVDEPPSTPFPVPSNSTLTKVPRPTGGLPGSLPTPISNAAMLEAGLFVLALPALVMAVL
jgi:hypothetical protein